MEYFCYHSTVLPKMNSFQGLGWQLSPQLVFLNSETKHKGLFYPKYMPSIPFSLLLYTLWKLILS